MMVGVGQVPESPVRIPSTVKRCAAISKVCRHCLFGTDGAWEGVSGGNVSFAPRAQSLELNRQGLSADNALNGRCQQLLGAYHHSSNLAGIIRQIVI